LCGSPASMIRWVADCEELPSEEPPETRKVIREHEHAGFTACPEYQAAIRGFYRKHVRRLNPWPGGLERSFAEACYRVYNTMNGRGRRFGGYGVRQAVSNVRDVLAPADELVIIGVR
jgi:hypothetical protein